MLQVEYLIQELADKTGVSPRTIRYYTEEGLLPEPVSRGKFAYYNAEHLDRLVLILQLKDRYLPLREIRQLMLSLSWPEVKALLKDEAKKEQLSKSAQHPLKSIREAGSDSALDYINRLLANQPGPTSPASRSQTSRSGLTDTASRNTTIPPETWRRIILAPGVELHLKEPTTAEDNDKINDLVEYARGLFQLGRK